jgi:hypothetical protein
VFSFGSYRLLQKSHNILLVGGNGEQAKKWSTAPQLQGDGNMIKVGQGSKYFSFIRAAK